MTFCRLLSASCPVAVIGCLVIVGDGVDFVEDFGWQ